MIYILPQAKFTQTTAHLKERGGLRRVERGSNLGVGGGETKHFAKGGGESCQRQHLFQSEASKEKKRWGGEVVNIITSALRFLRKTPHIQKISEGGKQDVLAAHITVKFQFYLRERSFIKSHD